MDCEKFREAIFQFVDNELRGEPLLEFRRHMACCPDCAQQRSYTSKWLVMVRTRVVRLAAPEGLRRRIVIHLRQRPIGDA